MASCSLTQGSGDHASHHGWRIGTSTWKLPRAWQAASTNLTSCLQGRL